MPQTGRCVWYIIMFKLNFYYWFTITYIVVVVFYISDYRVILTFCSVFTSAKLLHFLTKTKESRIFFSNKRLFPLEEGKSGRQRDGLAYIKNRGQRRNLTTESELWIGKTLSLTNWAPHTPPRQSQQKGTQQHKDERGTEKVRIDFVVVGKNSIFDRFLGLIRPN